MATKVAVAPMKAAQILWIADHVPEKSMGVFGIGLIPFGFALQSVQYWFGERKGSRMADNGPILVTGAAGQLGAVGRTVTSLLLDRGLPVAPWSAARTTGLRRCEPLALRWSSETCSNRPMFIASLTAAGWRIYFGMAVSAAYLEATVTMAAVARELGVNVLVNMSQMTVAQMSIQNTTPSPQQRQHWLSANVCLIHQ